MIPCRKCQARTFYRRMTIPGRGEVEEIYCQMCGWSRVLTFQDGGMRGIPLTQEEAKAKVGKETVTHASRGWGQRWWTNRAPGEPERGKNWWREKDGRRRAGETGGRPRSGGEMNERSEG